MERTVKDYGRFYAALKRSPGYGDEEERKRTLVQTYTQGRTTHLHEMTHREYAAMCQALEQSQDYVTRRKRQRSIALHIMQRMGIDTSDWARINDFCQNSRICGKNFGNLSIEELMALQKKLRAIERAGGLRREEQKEKGEQPPCNIKVTIINQAQDYGTDKQQQQPAAGEC